MNLRPDEPYRTEIFSEFAPSAHIEPITAQVVRDEQRFDFRTLGLPLLLFLATCWTTTGAHGPIYAAALMWILLSHEMGHYLQSRRYHVPATLPFFIPMPAGPLGTMGAVIAMRGNMGNRKSLFDIGISGPLAGLGPALICSIVGLQWSQVVVINNAAGQQQLGEPLLFKFLAYCIFGPLPETQSVLLHPLAFAGWVGIFITALNLFPIGQLDGGHVLYALLRKKAHLIATGLLALGIAGAILTQRLEWSLMLGLLVLMGPKHPPTGNDDLPLGRPRIILGWLTLLFVIIGFTPTPFG